MSKLTDLLDEHDSEIEKRVLNSIVEEVEAYIERTFSEGGEQVEYRIGARTVYYFLLSKISTDE